MKYLMMLLLAFSISAGELDEVRSLGVGFGEGLPIYVFASPTCPHCKRFHQQVTPKLIEGGYEVIYFMIAHDGAKSYKRAAEVYCAEDKKSQLNEFHATLLPEQLVDGTACMGVVDASMQLAATYEVNATPTVVLPDETTIKGVPDAYELMMRYLQAMNQVAKGHK